MPHDPHDLPGPAEPRRPPPESGRRIYTGERLGRDGRPDTQLRLNLDRYEGHGYVAVSTWEKGAGGWWPRKMLSFKRRELPGVIEALQRAHAALQAEAAAIPVEARARPQGALPGPARRERPDWRSSQLPPPVEGQGFDEFGNGA